MEIMVLREIKGQSFRKSTEQMIVKTKRRREFYTRPHRFSAKTKIFTGRQ